MATTGSIALNLADIAKRMNPDDTIADVIEPIGSRAIVPSDCRDPLGSHGQCRDDKPTVLLRVVRVSRSKNKIVGFVDDDIAGALKRRRDRQTADVSAQRRDALVGFLDQMRVRAFDEHVVVVRNRTIRRNQAEVAGTGTVPIIVRRCQQIGVELNVCVIFEDASVNVAVVASIKCVRDIQTLERFQHQISGLDGIRSCE